MGIEVAFNQSFEQWFAELEQREAERAASLKKETKVLYRAPAYFNVYPVSRGTWSTNIRLGGTWKKLHGFQTATDASIAAETEIARYSEDLNA